MEIIDGSTYEEVRKQNIARNEAFMKEIGLTPILEKKVITSSSLSTSKRKTLGSTDEVERVQPTRKSSRLSKENVEEFQELTDSVIYGM